MKLEIKLPRIHYNGNKQNKRVILYFTVGEKTGKNYKNLKPIETLTFTSGYDISYFNDTVEFGRIENEELIKYYEDTLKKIKKQGKVSLRKKEIEDLENTIKFLKKIAKFNKEYHLNDLQAGTEKQMKKLEEYNAFDMDYEEQLKLLSDFDLEEDNGYKYGESWLIKPLSKEKIEKELFQHIKDYIENLNSKSMKEYNVHNYERAMEDFKRLKDYKEINFEKQKDLSLN